MRTIVQLHACYFFLQQQGSCIESFLRGSTGREQMLVARSGLLAFLLTEVTATATATAAVRPAAGSLQTSYDLLGEIVKGNVHILQAVGAALTTEQLRRLVQVATSHLVDSNVSTCISSTPSVLVEFLARFLCD
jgi:Protein of unknown function (DUF3689)